MELSKYLCMNWYNMILQIRSLLVYLFQEWECDLVFTFSPKRNTTQLLNCVSLYIKTLNIDLESYTTSKNKIYPKLSKQWSRRSELICIPCRWALWILHETEEDEEWVSEWMIEKEMANRYRIRWRFFSSAQCQF